MGDTAQEDQDLRDMFDAIDVDKSGTLNLTEVIVFLKSVIDDISEDNIEKIFHNLDKSGDKNVDFNEFKVCRLYKYLETII